MLAISCGSRAVDYSPPVRRFYQYGAVALLIPLLCCASASPPASAPPLVAMGATPPYPRSGLSEATFPGSDGAPHTLAEVARGARFTVVTFFSADCPCQHAHDARLREMEALYRARGVAF